MSHYWQECLQISDERSVLVFCNFSKCLQRTNVSVMCFNFWLDSLLAGLNITHSKRVDALKGCRYFHHIKVSAISQMFQN